MEVDPPYLFGGGDRGDSYVSVLNDIDNAAIEIAVHGRWSRRLCLDVYKTLRSCLAEHPCAIIIDLKDLRDLYAESTAMWLAASRAAGLCRPPTQLALTMPPTRQLAHRLRELGVARTLPIFVTVEQARTAVPAGQPVTDHLQLRCRHPTPESVSSAADFVGAACADWQLPELIEPGQRVVSELVTNALRHGGSDVVVAVRRCNAELYLAVRDGDPRLPRLLDPPPGKRGKHPNERGAGLWSVHRQAAAWGASPAPGGKVVWAVVRSPQQPDPNNRDGGDPPVYR